MDPLEELLHRAIRSAFTGVVGCLIGAVGGLLAGSALGWHLPEPDEDRDPLASDDAFLVGERGPEIARWN